MICGRQFGVLKYGFKRIPKGFFDLFLFTVLFLTKYGKRPMHFFAGGGSLFAGGGMTLLRALTVLTLLRIDVPSLSLWLSAGFGILIGILLGLSGFCVNCMFRCLIQEKNSESFLSILRFGLSKTAVGGSLTLHVGIETALGGLLGLSLLFS